MNLNLTSIDRYIKQLQQELEGKTAQNKGLMNELEKHEILNNSLIDSKFNLSDEMADKKTKYNILKKEVDVKKSYLSSLIKANKDKVELKHLNNSAKIQELTEKNQNMTEIINSLMIKINKEKDSEELVYLSLIDSEKLINFMKIC